jgi:sulfite reductase (NADPH) flavoprotein alpha-component
MLAATELQTLQSLVAASSREQLIWMNGYLAGAAGITATAAVPEPAAPSVKKISVVYGTETGNSKKLATTLATRAKQAGIAAKVTNAGQYRLADLEKEEHLLVLISTQGDGEPPEAARSFYEHLQQTPALPQLRYSVLALGDTAYPLFCQAGADIDERLAAGGATRILPLQKCDVDYTSTSELWIDEVLQALQQQTVAPAKVATATPVTTGRQYVQGKLLANINLNGRGSAKATHHIELEAENVSYEPGDALGLVPHHTDAQVAAVLELAGADVAGTVTYKGETWSAANLLREKLSILHLPERVVKKYAVLVQQDIPATRIDLADLLRIYPLKDAGQLTELVALLDPITPRLYSIASSPAAHPGELHLTVAKDRFEVDGHEKTGLASGLLAGLETGTELSYYIHQNPAFRLPEPDKEIILVGPGTGIAPFRSFLAERDATGATGHNWLFFGEQHFATDFLYQTEIQQWVETGVLNLVNVAFSRDQAHKVYVQHRIIEQGAEVFKWLEQGAYFYLCGSKHPMSEDVENTLLQVIATHGKLDETAARAYLEQLETEGRYRKDVY